MANTSFSSPVFTGNNYGLVPRPPQPPGPGYYLASDGTWQPSGARPPIFNGANNGLVPMPAQPPAPVGATVLGDNGQWIGVFTSQRPGIVPQASNTGGQAVLLDNASWGWFGVFTTSTRGLVPPPPSSTPTLVLAANGSWQGLPSYALFTTNSNGLVPMASGGGLGNLVLADNATWVPAGSGPEPPFTATAPGIVSAPGAANGTAAFYIAGNNTAQPASFTLGNTLVTLGGTITALNSVTIGQSVAGAGTFTTVGAPTISCNTLTANQSITAGLNGGTTGTITVRGATSGGAIITAQPAAGFGTFQLPNITGTATFAVGATAPLVLNATTGMLTISSHTRLNRQVFGTVGATTYTPTPGTNAVFVRVIGGGGGGGGTANTGASQVSAGGGGGAGGYSERWITSGFSGVTVTVGAGGTRGLPAGQNGGNGGTSSFGALCSATGGVGGTTGPVATVPTFIANGGQCGVGSGGDFQGGGSSGGTGFALQLNGARGGDGGVVSPYTRGAITVSAGTAGGSDAGNYGGGGGGGTCAQSSTGTSGGLGSQGIIIVDEYT